MNTQGSPLSKGVNPNKGYPAAANVSGLKGGMPGFKASGTGGGATKVKAVHMGQPGSGHDSGESKRSSSTGYGKGGGC